MRKQIAAANWKMNLSWQKGETLLDAIHAKEYELTADQIAVFAVPFPYLYLAMQKLQGKQNVFVAAQNCSNKKSGAYTGEVSAEMLQSLGVPYTIIGHSERREYFNETNQQLAEKADLLLEYNITPIFLLRRAVADSRSGYSKRIRSKATGRIVIPFISAAGTKNSHRLRTDLGDWYRQNGYKRAGAGNACVHP